MGEQLEITIESEIAAMPRGALRTRLQRTLTAVRIARGERACGDTSAARRYLREARRWHVEAEALAAAR